MDEPPKKFDPATQTDRMTCELDAEALGNIALGMVEGYCICTSARWVNKSETSGRILVEDRIVKVGEHSVGTLEEVEKAVGEEIEKMAGAAITIEILRDPDRFVDDARYYARLGVSKDASSAQLKKAYHKLAQELHPDKSKRT